MTLAEIYAAQGHLDRAIAVLDEVLARSPDHAEARAMRARFLEQSRTRPRAGKPAAEAHARPTPDPIVIAGDEDEDAPLDDDEIDSRTVETLSAPLPAVAAPITEAPATPVEVAPATPVEAAPATPDESEPPLETAPAAAASLVEEGVPDRYDVDEIVAIAVDPRTIYLYWEVRATTLARAQARRPEGWLCIRVATVSATWAGPRVQMRDLHVDALYGDRFVRDLEPGSNVRVSAGWRAGEDYEPFAVGVEVEVPHLRPVDAVAEAVGRWEPLAGIPPFTSPAPRPAELAAARHDERAAPSNRPAPTLAGAVSGPQHGGAQAASPGRRRASAAPADTGVEIWHSTPATTWSEQRSVVIVHDDVEEVVFDEAFDDVWILAGASELSRSGEGARRRIVRRSTRGGVSELAFGGASELARP